MAGNRELLAKRKDELNRMDNRIHELQMRLKKKRAMNAEMVERNKNQLNKSNLNNKLINSKPNVAAVEPYIQEPQSTNSTNGFAKQDPKYQSLPPSSKFMYPEKGSRQRETNNNNVHYTPKQNDVEKSDEYSIPLVVSVDSSNKPVQNGLPPSPKQSPVNHTSGGQPLPPYPSSVSLQVPPHVPSSTAHSNQRYGPLTTQARSGVSHLTPKPYGSTYSSALVPNKGMGGVPNEHPPFDVQDEVRQSGSGQSSPGSVESVNSGNVKPLPPYPQRDGHDLSKGVPKDGQSVSRGPANEVQPIARGQQKDTAVTGGLKPPPPPVPNRGGAVPPSSLGQPLNNVTKSQQNNTSANSSENSSDNEQPTMSVSKGIQKFTGLIAQNSIEGQKGGGFSNLNHARSALTYRYASKKDIANTYLGKFDSEALEKYQKKVANLHRDLSAHSGTESGSPADLSPTAGPTEKHLKDEEKDSLSPLSNHSSPLSSASTPSPASPTRSPNYPFEFPTSPPHADVASDKVSYKPHTPKNVRRRHSDSDNEEVNKALNKYGINTPACKTLPVQENQLRELENNKGVVEIQATAFNDHIPETVLLDNKGNIVEVVDSVKDNTKVTKDEDTEKSATVTIEVKSSDPPVKKKTNLKSGTSKKSGNRVSFDPLALLLDASLEGELDLVRRCAHQVCTSKTY